MSSGRATIISNEKIAEGYNLLILESDYLNKNVLPGMFLEIDCGGATTLRRPFAYAYTNGNKTAVVYKVIGNGTKSLSSKQSGQYLDVLGPLGNSFEAEEKPILIAGGVGVPPIYFLAKTLSEKGITFSVVVGSQNKDALIFKKHFKNLQGVNLILTTDDGSEGIKGTVINGLQECEGKTIYVCGPVPMLKAVQEYCVKNNLGGFVSLEAYMGCGYGVCLGCAVKTTEGYKYCCKDGPIFPIESIIF